MTEYAVTATYVALHDDPQGVEDWMIDTYDRLSTYAASVTGSPTPSVTITVAAEIPTDAIKAAAKIIGPAPEFLRFIGVSAMDAETQDAFINEPALPELIGVSEVAAMLEVSKQRISVLRKTDYFPAPVADLAAGPVWTRDSLSAFQESWRRRAGRPSLV